MNDINLLHAGNFTHPVENDDGWPTCVTIGAGSSPYTISRLAVIRMGNILYQDSCRKGEAEYHAQNCTDESCEWCQSLCDQGIIVSCDGCGFPAHTDRLNFWTGDVDPESGGCLIYCPDCVTQ